MARTTAPLLLAALCLLAPAAAAAPAAEPLNVLLLYADDWRHDTLGAAGHPVLRTPSIDRLASEGVRFTHNYVTTSICGVSRASLLTGQWMARHGNRAFDMFETPWEETFPALLRAHGYWVGHVGKWHNGTFPAASFDFGRSYSGTHWLPQEKGRAVHVTQKNESDALEFLRTRPKGRPFCLMRNYYRLASEVDAASGPAREKRVGLARRVARSRPCGERRPTCDGVHTSTLSPWMASGSRRTASSAGKDSAI